MSAYFLDIGRCDSLSSCSRQANALIALIRDDLEHSQLKRKFNHHHNNNDSAGELFFMEQENKCNNTKQHTDISGGASDTKNKTVRQKSHMYYYNNNSNDDVDNDTDNCSRKDDTNNNKNSNSSSSSSSISRSVKCENNKGTNHHHTVMSTAKNALLSAINLDAANEEDEEEGPKGGWCGLSDHGYADALALLNGNDGMLFLRQSNKLALATICEALLQAQAGTNIASDQFKMSKAVSVLEALELAVEADYVPSVTVAQALQARLALLKHLGKGIILLKEEREARYVRK
jgi:hypothetical protein